MNGHKASLTRTAARRSAEHLVALPPGGYREFVAMGIERLTQRLESAQNSDLSD